MMRRLPRIPRRFWVRPALAACVMVFLIGITWVLLVQRRADVPTAPKAEPVRELTELYLYGVNNTPIRLEQATDDVRFIGLFASWCPYCADHLRVLDAFAQAHPELQVIAINRGEPMAVAREYLDRMTVSDRVTLLLDPDDSYYRSIGGYAMPEVVVVEKDGTISSHLRGPVTQETLEELYRARTE